MTIYNASDFGFTTNWQPPYRAGDQVAIINRTLGGKFFLEGRATVVVCRDEERALVDFGDGHPVERFIDVSIHGMADDELRDHIAMLNVPNEQLHPE